MSSPQPQTVEEREAEQARLYGQYVALVPIDIEGGRAFNVGHAVPVDHVERGVVRPDQVAKVTTKSGQQAAAAAGAPVNENSKG